MRTNLVVVSSIILMVWLAPATARTYRWVDENGVTIYSQSPPPSGQATIIKSPPPAPSSGEPGETMKKLKARLDAIDEDKKKKQEEKEKEEKSANKEENTKQNCESAKKNLAALKRHPRVRKKMEDGNYKMLTYEERSADIEKAKKAIKRYCD